MFLEVPSEESLLPYQQLEELDRFNAIVAEESKFGDTVTRGCGRGEVLGAYLPELGIPPCPLDS